MAKDPAFLFYPGDYLRDTQCLSESVQVAYDRIMCEHMRNICITQKQLKFFTKRLTPDEVEELLCVLTAVEGGYQITWVAESINKRKDYSDSRRTNRAGKNKKDIINISKSYDEHMENENINEAKSEFVLKKGEKLEFELNLSDFGKIVEFVRILTRELITHDQITERWEAFKIESESESYLSREKKINHFRNWLKNRIKNGEFKSSNSNGNGKLGTSAARDQYLQGLT
jgi:hypothetical protein